MDWPELLRNVSKQFEYTLSFRCTGRKQSDALMQRFEIAFKRPRFCIRFSDAFVAPDAATTIESHGFSREVGCGYLWIDEYGSHHERVEGTRTSALKMEWIPAFDVMLPVLLAMPNYPGPELNLRLLKNAIVDSNSECFVVKGQLARPDDTEFWFDQKQFVPSRVIQKDRFGASDQPMQPVSECTFANWIFNEPLDERLLAGPN
jgi:hypothetical protein